MSEASQQHPAAGATRLGTALAALGIAILLGNVALVVFDVVMRSLLRLPQSWVADVGQLSYPIAMACCFPVALETGYMITVRGLGERIGPRAARVLDVAGQLSMALLLSLFAWQMFLRAYADWSNGFSTSVINAPVAPTWLIVALVLALCALIQFRQTWRACARS